MQDLILIPTAFERSRIAEEPSILLEERGLVVELCGLAWLPRRSKPLIFWLGTDLVE